MNSIYFSQFYGISVDKEKDDWFDPRMDLDTKLCVDPLLVFKSNHPYFRDAQRKFIDFFQAVYSLAANPSNHDLLIKHSLATGEVRELCLGFSEKGIGRNTKDKDFATKVTKALALLDEKRNPDKELFKAIEIFTPGIGEDKISDAVANIIKKDLIEYTIAVCKKHPEIETELFPIKNVVFNHEHGIWEDHFFYLPKNPHFENTAVILVPKAFLRTIQSISSYELGNYLVGRPNEELRSILNNFLAKSIKKDDKLFDDFINKLKKGDKKTIFKIVNKYPELITEFLGYVEENADKFTSYDFEKDPDCLYTLPRQIYGFTSLHPISLSASNRYEFVGFIEKLISHFGRYISDHDGYKLFVLEHNQGENSQLGYRDEHSAQTIFRLFASFYLASNGIMLGSGDVKEINRLGEKPVKFTFPGSYENKALIKLKLFANTRFKKDDLFELFNKLRDDSIEFCYYVTMLYYTSEFQQMKEKLEEVKSVDTKEVRFKPVVMNASQNRTANLFFNQEHMLEEQEVCISYARKDISEKLVDKLCEVLRAEGIKYVRDSEELKYKDNLRQFMARLGRGKCIVAVISDKYLKSDYCMDEMIQANKQGNLRDRIVPVVMADAGKIYDPIKSLAYNKYWRERAEETEAEVKNYRSADTKGSRYYLDLFADIERNISEVIDFLRNLLVEPVEAKDEEELESLDFTDVLSEIKKILSKP